MAPFAGLVKHQLSALLMTLRDEIDVFRLELDRLPGWIQGSDIRAGWIGESVIAVFEEAAQDEDRFHIRGTVRSDVVILLDTPDFPPTGASLEARDSPGAIILAGSDAHGDPSAGSTMVLGAERPAFFDCGYAGYHGPRLLWNLIFSLEHTLDSGPVERRFIPFAIYLHEADLRSIRLAWERIKVHLLPTLADVHSSPAGDYYAERNARTRAMQRAARPLALSKDSGVVVLGSYSPSQSKEELLQVRNQIRAMGYDAQLVVNMPEVPMMSNEEKVRLWTIVARFSVMVDRVPSGHIAEYLMLKEQRSILAMLRPRGVASTSMIGDASLVDIRHIRIFEFDDTPLEVLEEAVLWAEALATERAQQYDAAYRWRRREP